MRLANGIVSVGFSFGSSTTRRDGVVGHLLCGEAAMIPKVRVDIQTNYACPMVQ